MNVAEWSIQVKSTPLEFVQAIMAELSVTERTLLGYFGHPADSGCSFAVRYTGHWMSFLVRGEALPEREDCVARLTLTRRIPQAQLALLLLGAVGLPAVAVQGGDRLLLALLTGGWVLAGWTWWLGRRKAVAAVEQLLKRVVARVGGDRRTTA